MPNEYVISLLTQHCIKATDSNGFWITMPSKDNNITRLIENNIGKKKLTSQKKFTSKL